MVLADIFEQLDALPNPNLVVCAHPAIFDELNDPKLVAQLPAAALDELEGRSLMLVPPEVFIALTKRYALDANGMVLLTSVEPVKEAYASLLTIN